MSRLVAVAPAKVNLYLGVVGARPDGFHDVTTVMHTLELSDTVVLEPAEELSLVCDADLGITAVANLAHRAAIAFGEEFGVEPGVAITIHKRIPAGAGLAGGSSDAAAVLTALALRHGVAADDPRLLSIARSLGADCAFLLLGGAALMAGRGDELVRRLPTIEAHIALVMPAEPVPTGEAYAAWDRSPIPPDGPEAAVAALLARDPGVLGVSLSNNLTSASSSIVPAISEALSMARSSRGVLGAAMAGSGSAIFAVCEDESCAEDLAAEARGRGYWSVATQTRATGVEVAEEGAE